MAKYNAIVIGVSAGGMEALTAILPVLPADLSVPVFIVQHRSFKPDSFLEAHLDSLCNLKVMAAIPNQAITLGNIYIAPGGYHLLIEQEHTLSLSIDAPVSFSIPSIDVLFVSAADVYKEKLIGVILTGANTDGSLGLKKIRERGGLGIVQDPEAACARSMPENAIALAGADHVLTLQDIGPFLVELCHGK